MTENSKPSRNTRTYMVVIETTSEIPALGSVGIKVDATSRTAAENFGWRWAKENEIEVVEIEVYLK